MTTTITQRAGESLFDQASVADAMSSGLISCAPQTPLRVVARTMAVNKVHAVFVFDYGVEEDESKELWGLVSDLDLAAASPVIDERTAGNSSITPLVTITSDAPLGHAAQLMAEYSTAHLAVLDPVTKRPAGVISTLDIARVLGDAG